MMFAMFISAYIATTNTPITTWQGLPPTAMNTGSNAVPSQQGKSYGYSSTVYTNTVPNYQFIAQAPFTCQARIASATVGHYVDGTGSNVYCIGNLQPSTVSVKANSSPVSATVYNFNGAWTSNSVTSFIWQSFTNGTPEQNCLQYKLWAGIVALTNGADTNGATLYKNAGGWTTDATKPIWVTNSWLKNVTNAMIGGMWDTNMNMISVFMPISPLHCITECHVGNSGWRIFLCPDGHTLYTNYVVASAPTFNGDLCVMLMAYTNVGWMRCIPCDARWVNKVDYSYKYLPVCIRQHWGNADNQARPYYTSFTSHWNLYQGSYACGTNNAQWQFGPTTPALNPIFGNQSLGDIWVAGDSSSIAMAILNNEVIEICAAWYPSAGPSWDTNALNAVMYNLSTNNNAPVYQCTPIDINQFPDL